MYIYIYICIYIYWIWIICIDIHIYVNIYIYIYIHVSNTIWVCLKLGDVLTYSRLNKEHLIIQRIWYLRVLKCSEVMGKSAWLFQYFSTLSQNLMTWMIWDTPISRHTHVYCPAVFLLIKISDSSTLKWRFWSFRHGDNLRWQNGWTMFPQFFVEGRAYANRGFVCFVDQRQGLLG